MVAAASPVRVSFAEYIAIDEQSDGKHEYIHGVVHAMAGGSPEHARMTMAIGRELSVQLAGKRCAVYSSDLRVRVRATGLATYPDITVVCGKLELDPENRHTVTNPIFLVEVTSPSTKSYDREIKCAHYRRIESLRAYAIVSHDERLVEVFTRNSDGTWTVRDVSEGIARLDPIECTLSLDAIYHDPLAS